MKKTGKHIKEIGGIIYRHVKENARDYLILSIIFIIGVMIGVVIINNSDDNSKTELNGYINSFIDTIKNESFQVDKPKLIKDTIINNLKILLIIWIAGTTIIGIPLIYIITIYRGISIGYTVSAIMLTLGNWKGFIFSISALFLQNIIVIPIILMLNVSSLKLHRILIKKERNTNIKQELIRHTALCAILVVPIIFATLISCFVSSNLLVFCAKSFAG